jgi:2-dehydro-3-deoxyphosphooctonate aldolase (KDO 8-P synthase)
MLNIIAKIESAGNNQILLTERGSFFGYGNLVVDFRSLPIMAKTGYPVVMDVTHSVQRPSGQGDSSGGEREFIEPLACAAIAVGVGAIFMEVHDNPDQAMSDGPSQLHLNDLEKLLVKLKNLDRIIKAPPKRELGTLLGIEYVNDDLLINLP